MAIQKYVECDHCLTQEPLLEGQPLGSPMDPNYPLGWVALYYAVEPDETSEYYYCRGLWFCSRECLKEYLETNMAPSGVENTFRREHR